MSTLLSFEEWVAHWGEERLQERVAESMKSHKRLWELREDSWRAYRYPVWELAISGFWYQSQDEWHVRWQGLGGRIFEGRMIAPKSDKIWLRIADTFYDGLGNPYPPYSKSSCVSWRELDQDEAIVLGVISENELNALRPSRSELGFREDLSDCEKKHLAELAREMRENRPSRVERVEQKEKRQAEAVDRARTTYEERSSQRNQKYREKSESFRLLEQVEEQLDCGDVEVSGRKWCWLCESVTMLTSTELLERYPIWRARARLAAADLHRASGDTRTEVSCLELALELNPKIPIRRRLKKLLKEQSE